MEHIFPKLKKNSHPHYPYSCPRLQRQHVSFSFQQYPFHEAKFCLQSASFTRAAQFWLVCKVLALPKIQSDNLALVKATFIRLTSATNPIEFEFTTEVVTPE
ncbi:hypothetical protein VIGAN_07001300 [Vigna angularis var. angularis]|uniref:Uncharacterized protein n=1 Tax=Vigna angularis var. angularis TaxID=157739 RepID=A0A0S3SF22_PHAAN|nr:hypothetical protein VIGAN_07001300 [Vigna angularis var. angularis]